MNGVGAWLVLIVGALAATDLRDILTSVTSNGDTDVTDESEWPRRATERRPVGGLTPPMRHTARVQREEVLTWVAGYERAWREGDLDALAGLFAEQAQYRHSPYEPSKHGLAEIRASWLEDDDVRFTMSAELVALDGDVAVVRAEVDYVEPVEQQYRDLWLIRFGPDGRAVDFEEWAYWPGKSYSASFDSTAS